MAYLLDADVFIRAKNLHYGFDLCPGFWDWLLRAHAGGSVYSVEKVGDELAAVQDELSVWARETPPRFFQVPTEATLPALARVAQWASAQSYTSTAISTFQQVADYYLVAQALAHGHAVVTHEVPSDSTRRIKIPNACIGLGVKCLTPFEMLRREGARFVLEA